MWDTITAAWDTRAASEASGKKLFLPRSETDASTLFSYHITHQKWEEICIILNMNVSAPS